VDVDDDEVVESGDLDDATAPAPELPAAGDRLGADLDRHGHAQDGGAFGRDPHGPVLEAPVPRPHIESASQRPGVPVLDLLQHDQVGRPLTQARRDLVDVGIGAALEVPGGDFEAHAGTLRPGKPAVTQTLSRMASP
jgi:hypothetical protein